jgi:hypothetical protein
MKYGTMVLILLGLSSVAAADCITDCMQRSGCWSGRSITDPHACNVQPELCRIQCQGKGGSGWAAIAYSKKDKIAGWSFEQSDRATAERVALQYCTKEGGVKCEIWTSFNGLCGAVAADGDLAGWGTAGSQAGAKQRAISECAKQGGKRCEVEASVCSSGASSSGAAPSTPTPPKSISWGAIAYSSADMGAGWSQGKDDRASAVKEAMAACSQRGKACVVRTAFNKQCAALAADRDFTGSGTSTDQRAAQQKAIDDCKKAGGSRCVLHISFCSF